jgi:RNA-directed DNA polymerase
VHGAPRPARRTAAARVLARRPHPDSAAIATALAHAYLAAEDWTADSLAEAGASALGLRRRFLGVLGREVVAELPRPPVGSARLLTAVIERSAAFEAGLAQAESRGVPLQVRHWALVPDRSAVRPPLPAIDTVADLADLLGISTGLLDRFADTKHLDRRAPDGSAGDYRYRWALRPGRTPRLLEIPGERLRRVQRTVLETLVGLLPVTDAAHGFVPGRSARTGAARHTGRSMVICLDLTTFFASVTAPRIYGVLRRAGYSESVAYTLTGLGTHAVPVRVLREMPPGGSVDERFALRRRLSASHLPQGAPTSPALANLAVRQLDLRLTGWADAAHATYTRYADDLAFSGGDRLAARADAFVRGVDRIVRDEGLDLNAAKTRVRHRSRRQVVTGIVVNERPAPTRADVDRLRATLHNCVVLGVAGQDRSGTDDFRAHLLGRISWVESLDVARGARLRAEFDRIRW